MTYIRAESRMMHQRLSLGVCQAGQEEPLIFESPPLKLPPLAAAPARTLICLASTLMLNRLRIRHLTLREIPSRAV